ncbi:MAG: hypothetical protein FJ290_33295 [Planctomycetes bacterium]|nr:hypothetical protein [Planctomycetota bacterium]
MRWDRLIAAIVGAMAVCVAVAGQGAEEGGLVLDGTGYFRQHVEFGLMKLNGDVLRREGEKLFGAGLRRLERDVKKLLEHKGYDWEKTDWRDAAVFCFISAQVGDDRGAIARLPSARQAGKDGYALEPMLNLTAAGGRVSEQYPVKVFVIPPYREPSVPTGEVVWLRELDAKKYVKRHVDGALHAHSGIVAVSDKPRLLVVTGLAKAREVRLNNSPRF